MPSACEIGNLREPGGYPRLTALAHGGRAGRRLGPHALTQRGRRRRGRGPWLRTTLSRGKEARDTNPHTTSATEKRDVMSIQTDMSHPSVLAAEAGTTRRASCSDATDALALANGTQLLFRPIGPGDRDRLSRLFDRLSPESRRRRFLSPKRELTAPELAYLTDIDHVRHEAIGAVDQREDSIVGVARYASFPDRSGVAEVAVAVVDDLQSMGIGTELAKRVVGRARANGLWLLTATTLWENRPARALLRRVQFRAVAGRGAEIELALQLKPAEPRNPANDD